MPGQGGVRVRGVPYAYIWGKNQLQPLRAYNRCCTSTCCPRYAIIYYLLTSEPEGLHHALSHVSPCDSPRLKPGGFFRKGTMGMPWEVVVIYLVFTLALGVIMWRTW